LRLSIVKTAVDERGDRRLAREARWLRELNEVPELEGQIPRLLEEGVAADGRRYLVVSGAPQPGTRRSGETRAFTEEHARFLARLGKARFRALDFELSGCGAWLQRSLVRAASFGAPRAHALLREAFHDCETALLYWTGPYVVAQGEFAPWNIRTFGGQLFVSEWGGARTEASPLDDVLHYLVVQRALSQRPLDAPFLRSAMERARQFALEAYPDWSWRPQVIGALTLAYLLGTTLHHALARSSLERDDDPALDACWKLLQTRAEWMPPAQVSPRLIPETRNPENPQPKGHLS
jgi:hypothetical protein